MTGSRAGVIDKLAPPQRGGAGAELRAAPEALHGGDVPALSYQPSGAMNAGLRSDTTTWSRQAPSM